MTDADVKPDGRNYPLQANSLMPDSRAAISASIFVPRIAAIRIADDTPTDDLLETVVRTLQDEGSVVAGFIQRQGCQDLSGHAEMLLEEIPGGQQFRISQPLGKDSRGCRLDPQAIADIAGPLLKAIESKPDFLVLNRFGKGESEGQGFRSVLEKAFLLGIPVLTSVKQTYADAWEAFGGDCSTSLPPSLESVLDWSRAVVAQSNTGTKRAMPDGSKRPE
jgi:Mor family transcriptional regulator